MYTTSVVLVVSVISSLQIITAVCLFKDGNAMESTALRRTNTSLSQYENSRGKLKSYRNNGNVVISKIQIGSRSRNGTHDVELDRKETRREQVKTKTNNSIVVKHFEPRRSEESKQAKVDNNRRGSEQKDTRKLKGTISQKRNYSNGIKHENLRSQQKFHFRKIGDTKYTKLSQKYRHVQFGASVSHQQRRVIGNAHHHHVHHHHRHHHHHHHHHLRHQRNFRVKNSKAHAFVRSRWSALVTRKIPRHHRTRHKSSRISKNTTYVNHRHKNRVPIDTTQKAPAHKNRVPIDTTQKAPAHKNRVPIDTTQKAPAHKNRVPIETTQQAPAQKRFIVVAGPHSHHRRLFHFSPALVNALRLVLDKRNSFKKDADIMNLAQALQSKDSSDGNIGKNNSITTSISSGLTRNGQRVRLVTVKDPGYIKAEVHGQQQGTKVKVRQQEELLKQAAYHGKGDTNARGYQQRGPTASQFKDHGGIKPKVHVGLLGLRQAAYHKDSGYTKPKVHIREGLNNVGDTKARVPSRGELQGAFRSRSKISEDLNLRAHAALVNPTTLGISILKLLFGKRAKLVVKPKYRLLVGGRPGLKYLEGYGTPRQRAELQKEIEQENKMILLKGIHKEKFETTLAKSVSNLINAMNKNQRGARKHKSRLKRKPTEDLNGTRKSWVLLKIPKHGEKEDENVQRYQDKEVEKSFPLASKQVTTVGKHNNMISDTKVITHHKPDVTSSYDDEPPRKPKEISMDTPSKTVPLISYNLSGIKTKNELAKTPSPDSSAISTTLGKILKGIQDSIKELRDQRKTPESSIKVGEKVTPLGPLSSLGPLTSQESLTSSDTSPVSKTSSDASQAAAVAKIPDLLTAVNKLLGTRSHSMETPNMPGVPSDQTGVQSSAISVPTVDTDAARRFVDGVRQANDPLLSKPALGMYDEPITTSSHSKNAIGQQPGDNVLFESDELATQRDTQANLDAFKLKEDLEAFAERGLNAHNRYRVVHNAPKLKWSDDLATQAEKLAYNMAMKGAIEKSEIADTFGYGENVAKITGATFNRAGEEATNLWYGEMSNYSFSDPRLSPQTDSFTQVIWKGSTKLGMGCARDLQTNDLYVVALYFPKGNDAVGLRSNVLNKGEVTQDVYASIFKRQKLHSNG